MEDLCTGQEEIMSVSINPSEHSDETERDRLLRMTCEEAIADLAQAEMARPSGLSDEANGVTRVSYRYTLQVLDSALTSISKRVGRSRRLVIQCLAHKGVVMLEEVEGLLDINQKRYDISECSGEFGGISDVENIINRAQYDFVCQSCGSGHYHMAGWLYSKYQQLTTGVGISPSRVITIGLCLAVGHTNDPKLSGVSKDMEPEVSRFRQYIKERYFVMDAYWNIVNLRIDDIQGR